jgi:hypothetical protein
MEDKNPFGGMAHLILIDFTAVPNITTKKKH